MTESIYAYVLERLQASKGRWGTVAEDTGISRRTIEKIARQEFNDPGVRKIELLAKYFREQEQQPPAQPQALNS